jgi:hypothetical protein
MGTTQYIKRFDHLHDVDVLVWFETDRDDVTDYALVLVFRDCERVRTVRVYDGAHGRNEMHRYTRKLGKQPAEFFHGGTLGDGMRAALEQISDTYEEMIEGWRRG